MRDSQIQDAPQTVGLARGDLRPDFLMRDNAQVDQPGRAHARVVDRARVNSEISLIWVVPRRVQRSAQAEGLQATSCKIDQRPATDHRLPTDLLQAIGQVSRVRASWIAQLNYQARAIDPLGLA